MAQVIDFDAEYPGAVRRIDIYVDRTPVTDDEIPLVMPRKPKRVRPQYYYFRIYKAWLVKYRREYETWHGIEKPML